ncbi:MAG: biotin/lipoyl-binding protein [Pirellulaceae bacterium]|nr:biotin/lipoyl-binding protein [Pirellulaceae bacterium]
MATLADSLVSSASRPLTLRMRPDLTARRQRYHGQSYWVVKEPIGLNYFRFHEEEYAILCMMDGRISLEAIKERFEQEFMPQKITYQDLQQFVGMLHRSGLVVADAIGQGHQLRKRRDQKKRRELLGKLTNVFALRWRGIDPEWLLNRLYPFTRWFFARPVVLFHVLLACCALLLITVQFDVFRARLPSFHQFFGNWENWLVMGIAMAVVKVLHEFGHGLSCKHFGGECHEMGFMLLVFTPALYCNVSDSWMLPNKWHRAFIGAAGMYVEMVIASLATFIWWFSDRTTLINQVCLSLMFICSVSTLLFNGNPLLRFDGYYILMDLIEIPNLRQKSTEVLKRFLVQLCLGIEQPENPFLPQRNRFLFGLFTVAAVIYRWIVVFSILLFLNKVLEPYGLKIIGRIVGAIGLFGLIVQPLWQLGKFFYMPGRMHKVKRHRVLATLTVVAVAVAAFLFLPLPFHLSCNFDVKPRDAATVYAAVDGQLRDVLAVPGQRVEQGEVLARLDNLELQLNLLRLQSDLRELDVKLQVLEKQQRLDEEAGRSVKELTEQREALVRVIDEKQQELDNLVVKAPVAGIVLPVADKPDREPPGGQLPGWAGDIMHPTNRDALLAANERICLIGDPARLVAEVIVDQSDVELVRAAYVQVRQAGGSGVAVELMLDALPGVVLASEIEQIALTPLTETPLSLSTHAGGDVNSVADAQTGVPRPLSTSYPAIATLPETDTRIQLGMRGKAKVYTGWQPLGRRVYRFITRTFHFEL